MIKAIKNICLYSFASQILLSGEEKMKWKSLSTPCILYPCLHSSSIQLQFFWVSLACACVHVCVCALEETRSNKRQTQYTRPQYVNRASPTDYSSLLAIFVFNVFVVDSIRWFSIYLSLFIDFYCYSMMKIASSRDDVLSTIALLFFWFGISIGFFNSALEFFAFSAAQSAPADDTPFIRLSAHLYIFCCCLLCWCFPHLLLLSWHCNDIFPI